MRAVAGSAVERRGWNTKRVGEVAEGTLSVEERESASARFACKVRASSALVLSTCCCNWLQCALSGRMATIKAMLIDFLLLKRHRRDHEL